jgi:hypothetical protein
MTSSDRKFIENKRHDSAVNIHFKERSTVTGTSVQLIGRVKVKTFGVLLVMARSKNGERLKMLELFNGLSFWLLMNNFKC